jgi:hypothetical protein
MQEDCLPYADLELVKQVCGEDTEDIEAEGPELLGEYILDDFNIEHPGKWECEFTSVGTRDCADNVLCTAADAMLA